MRKKDRIILIWLLIVFVASIVSRWMYYDGLNMFNDPFNLAVDVLTTLLSWYFFLRFVFWIYDWATNPEPTISTNWNDWIDEKLKARQVFLRFKTFTFALARKPLPRSIVGVVFSFQGLVVFLLLAIIYVLLRPSIEIVKTPIEETYSCRETKLVHNPKFDEEKQAWITNCMKNVKGFLPETTCRLESYDQKFSEPSTVYQDIESICSRKVGMKNRVILEMFTSDKVLMDVFTYKTKQ